MTVALVSYDRIVFLAASIENATKAGYPTTDIGITDPLRPPGDFRNSVITADSWVAGQIKDNLNHRYRPLFYDKVDYAYGAIIKDYTLGTVAIIGSGIGAVYVPGKRVPPDTLARYKQNVLALSTTEGYYSLEGNSQDKSGTIYFTGSMARLDILKQNDAADTGPFSPAEYEMGVLAGVMMITFPKDGKFVQAGEHFFGIWRTCMDLIRAGAPGNQLPKVDLSGVQ